MKKILGLDLGTNSIGWAVTKLDFDNKQGEILGLGSRIIPMDGNEISNFKKGLPQTKNAKKREKKSVRKGNKRYKARRNKLIYVLQKLDLLPEQIKLSAPFNDPLKIAKVNILPIDTHTPQLTAKEFFELKSKAIHEPVSKKDFGRILYRFNQLRGYSGGDENEEFQEEIDDVLEVKTEQEYPAQESRIQTFKILKYSKTDEKKKNKIIYKITVLDIDNKEWEGETIVEGIKEGEFVEMKQTIRRNKKTGEITSMEFSIPNKTGWRKKMENLERALEEHSKRYGRKTYLSEYFLDVLKENKWQKIRNNVILRQRYKEEFDAIWETQAQVHLNNVDKKTIEEIASFLFPGTSDTQQKLRQEAIDKGIKHIIKEQIIYYQRPLKDQSHLIGECRFEKGEKVVAKSHPLFQEYKLWEQINKLSITRKTQVGIRKNGKVKFEYKDRTLLAETKEILFEELQSKAELNFNSVFKIIKKLEDFRENIDFFNGLSSKSKLIGNTTRITLKKRLGKYWDILNINNLDNQIELWDILYNGKGNEYDINSERNKMLAEFLIKKGISRNTENFDKIVIAISTIKFKRDYASLSLKAIRKVLPIVRAGKYFNESDITQELKERIIKIVNENLTDPYEISLQNYLENNEQIVLEQGGFINAYALMLVYGKHTAKEISNDEVFESFNEIKALKQNSLRNPLVEQMVNETLMIIKDIWKKYGRPDEIKIEFARELQNSIKERKKIHEANENARKTNERIKKRLAELKKELSKGNIEKYKLWESQVNKDEKFIQKYEATKNEVEKMKLWEEQGHIDPYTGKPIPLSKVFNKSEYDVDHIIPQSRYFDDSLSNKVLTASVVNRDKGNRTAMEYFEAGSQKVEIFSKEDFIQHVSTHFFGKKRKNLLATKIPDNPIERQKKETQYITLKVREELAKIVGTNKVKTSTGGITHYLRNHWGVTDVFKSLLKERFEDYYKLKAKKIFDSLIKEEKDLNTYLKELVETKLPEYNQDELIKEIESSNIDNEEIFTNIYLKIHIYKDNNNNQIIKGYSKRLDHRHHAMDALIVALTDEKAVKRLNDLNKNLQDWLKNNINRFGINFNEENDDILNLFSELYEGKRAEILSEVEKFRNVEIPWKGFQKDVKNALENILVSHKPKDKILIQPKEEKDDKGNVRKIKDQKIIRIRGALHEDTIYGLFQNKYEAYRIPLTKFAGQNFDTKGNIEKIVNKFLRETIREHFKNYNNKKEAFKAEGVMVLNKKLAEKTIIKNGVEIPAPHPPIHSVKVYRKKPDKNYTISLQKLDRKDSYNDKLYVLTGNNYLFAVLEKDDKRVFDLISLFDAVNLIKEEFKNTTNKDLFDKNKVFKEYFENKNNAKLRFTLKQLDMVYLPEEGEEVILDEDSPLYQEYWSDKKRLKNIFTVEKFSGKRVYFLHHNYADVIEKKVELGSQDKLEFFKGRKIIEHCIPIKLDRLGQIQKVIK